MPLSFRPTGGALCLLALTASVASAADDRGLVQPKPGFRDAVTAPLEDLNLKKRDIPDLLLRAQGAPYDLKGLDHCEAIAAEVGRLNAVLGPDLEEAPPPDTRSRTRKAAGQAHSVAVEVVQDRTRSLIPFRSWIRKLTGANRNQTRLDAAVRAGAVRRGYLKGVGMRMNCRPPAAPSWFVPKPATVARAAPPKPAPEPLWLQWWRGFLQWLHRVAPFIKL
jgi:hypothetical protein